MMFEAIGIGISLEGLEDPDILLVYFVLPLIWEIDLEVYPDALRK